MRNLIFHIFVFFYFQTKKSRKGYRFFYCILIQVIKMLNHIRFGQGITKQYFEVDVVISLTSYGKRIEDVFITIESIFCGKILPNRMILWLDNSYRHIEIPNTLKRLQKRGLEIRFTENILSYKKLIPTLKSYPNSIIVTIDDDAIYSPYFLCHLLSSYAKHPNYIHANRVHKIKFDNKGQIAKYLDWTWEVADEGPSALNVQTGVGGVLYPPHSLSEEVFNQDVFMDICQFGDDIWFYAMGIMNGFCVYRVQIENNMKQDYIDMLEPKEQALSLLNTDPVVSKNDIQIRDVFRKYDICSQILHFKNNLT